MTAPAPVLAGTVREPRAYTVDAVTILTVFLVLLLAIPSRFVAPQLGSAGGPATVLALAATFWWCWYHIQRTEPEGAGRQPVRTAALIFFTCGIASYAAAMLRAIPSTEVSTANSGMLRLLAWTGILLVANDGISDAVRLKVLLRRLILAAGFVALLGLVQFVTQQMIVDRISIPGLVSNQDVTGLIQRSNFSRSVGTAIHPLEYSAVLTMAFPLALTRGLESGRSLVARWWPAAAIAAACTVSSSRSTMLALAAGVLVMMFSWAPSIRRRMLAAGAALITAVFLVVPGMLGLVLSLFSGLSGDSSAQSRWGSLDLVVAFWTRSPLVGRGFATFLPEYRILDNQYFMVLVEMGLLGLLALGALIATAFVCAELTRRRGMSDLKPWAQALSASIISGATCLALFDGFAFPQAAGLFFMVAGLCGAIWRIARNPTDDQQVATGDPRVAGENGARG